MASILSRLERIREQLDHAGGIAVTFKSGMRRIMDGGACIDLVLNDPCSISKFEALGDGNGALPDLLNKLLN